MMEAVKDGAGREDAHAAIKEHAVATVKELRTGVVKENDLITRLASDPRIGLGTKKIENLMKEGKKSWGSPWTSGIFCEKSGILGWKISECSKLSTSGNTLEPTTSEDFQEL